MEAPESPTSLNGTYLVTTRGTLNGKNVRNYSILYDPSRYASYGRRTCIATLITVPAPGTVGR